VLPKTVGIAAHICKAEGAAQMANRDRNYFGSSYGQTSDHHLLTFALQDLRFERSEES
jgi:hypothetical protein